VTPIRFVELGKCHFPLLAGHYVETYNAPPWNDAWTEELAAEKLDLLMDRRGAFGLVCYEDGGSFADAVLGHPDIYHNCRQFFVEELFVSLTLQGKGIGTQQS